MQGSIVLLYGPPAAGKSSLAREVLRRFRALGQPLLYLGTDSLRETVSGHRYIASVRPTIYEGLLAMTEAAARSGHHVLVDGNYLEEAHRRALLEGLQGFPVLKVLVHCPLEVGLRRNAGRVSSERVPEDYLRQVYARVPGAVADADMVLDTPDSEAALGILRWLLGYEPPASSFNDEWSRQAAVVSLQAGETVWQAGGTSCQVMLLLEGELEVVREGVVINRLGPGELAGELSSLDGHPHSATVRAAGPARVAVLESDEFRSLLRRHPELLDLVMLGMVARIRNLSQAATAACLDVLTGLSNRRILEERLPEARSLALFDVDRFKSINDTFGHQAGDHVLQEVGRLLRELGPDVVPIRLGGDEFVVLFPHDAAQALERMEAFVARIRLTEFEVQPGCTLRITVSVGVADGPPHELQRRADEAAYASKREGRDRITLSAGRP